jgi:hypothetical protein
MRAVAVLVLMALAAASWPWAAANPDQCDVFGGRLVQTGPGAVNVTVDQYGHQCAGPTGSQSLNFLVVNATLEGQRHNVTYRSETDTGTWTPFWCNYPPGSAQCSAVTVGLDSTNLTARYRQDATASWCEYSFILMQPTSRSSATLPNPGFCFDYLTLLP